MSGLTAENIATIREKAGPNPRMVVHDVWIEHVRISSRKDAICSQIVYEVFDCRSSDEETFGTFIGALNRILELLKN